MTIPNTTARDQWRSVSRHDPCPACGKPDWCVWLPDGKTLRCMRTGTTPAGMEQFKTDGKGGTLYRAIGHNGWHRDRPRDTASARPRALQSAAPGANGKTVDLQAFDVQFREAAIDERVAALAGDLGVTVAALRALGIGWATTADLQRLKASGAGWKGNNPEGAYSFPERNGQGRLVGFSFRAVDGRKGGPSSSAGCQRGLIVPAGFRKAAGPVLIVEGASDVSACVALGCAAVGRPSNRSGAEDLAVLLDGSEVLVVGENDAKDSGAWPGRDGAKAVAERLAGQWSEPVSWALPPSEVKDIREWLRARVAAGLDLADENACMAAGRDLVEQLQGEAREVKPRKSSTADRIVAIAREQFRLGVSEDREPFAVAIDGTNVALTIGKGSELRTRLAAEYFARCGRSAPGAALADAMGTLEGLARQAEPEPVALRLARLDESIVLDLGTAEGAAVVIQPGSWEVVERSPVLFRRTALTGAMPVPERGGKLEDLRSLLNVTDTSWPLIRGWLVVALFPGLPRPVLMLGGEQGTGKSTAARLLVELFDPSAAPLRSQPRDPESWALAAAGSWAVAIDNISTIPDWWSDGICKAVSGDGWVRRTLYTDKELSVVSFRRVILLTSIDAGALRGDLAERLLVADLEPINSTERRTDREIADAYSALRPRLLGALLDLLAKVLDALPQVTTRELPRMADFARVLAALDLVDGLDGSALDLYVQQAGRLAEDVIESDPVAVALLRFIDGTETWQGTATTLLGTLSPSEGRLPQGWPKTARGLTARLKRLRPALARVGVDVLPNRRDSTAKRERLIHIENQKAGGTTVRTVQPSKTGPVNQATAEPQPSEVEGAGPAAACSDNGKVQQCEAPNSTSDGSDCLDGFNPEKSKDDWGEV